MWTKGRTTVNASRVRMGMNHERPAVQRFRQRKKVQRQLGRIAAREIAGVPARTSRTRLRADSLFWSTSLRVCRHGDLLHRPSSHAGLTKVGGRGHHRTDSSAVAASLIAVLSPSCSRVHEFARAITSRVEVRTRSSPIGCRRSVVLPWWPAGREFRW